MELADIEVDSIERISDLIHHPLIDCRRPQPNKVLVHGADILWTGIGEQTLVQFSSKNNKRRKAFARDISALRQGNIRFETKSMRFLKTTPHIDTCFYLSNDRLFDAGNHELTLAARERVKEFSEAIIKLGVPSKISVWGVSDLNPRSTLDDSRLIDNQKLSELRALVIIAWLKALIGQPTLPIVLEDAASRQARTKCSIGDACAKYKDKQCIGPNGCTEISATYDH